MNRRTLLALAGGASVAVVAGCGGPNEGGTGTMLESRLPLPDAFKVPLLIPPVAKSVRRDDTTDYYEITQRAAKVEIIPGTKTTIWGYDGIFPGPTFMGKAGRRMVVKVKNELPVPTSTHLHGGVTPAGSDGFPTDLVAPKGYNVHAAHTGHGGMAMNMADWKFHDQAKDYEYPMVQRAATLWYHDHRMDFSAPQVWRGLAGAFLVTDAEESALPLPRKERDIPLIIGDRSFEADGEFRYPSLDSTLTKPGVTDEWMSGVFGDVILVNGRPWPFLEVEAVRYRFRLVNGSNARRYTLTLGGGLKFTQVGGDGGLLPVPVEHGEITIAPGERYDVVVDFSAVKPGSSVVLANTLGEGRTRDVMKFVVTRAGQDDSRIPAVLSQVPKLTREQAVATRQFDFRLLGGKWTINGKPYDTSASLASPKLGTVELWRFTSDFHHPVHMHLAHFQVLSRGGRGPGPLDGGWKDTVDVRPYEVVEVLAKFDGFQGRYMLHCHNLEHEDMAMMANFDVV
ncbi:multicopper oxidase family protein [Longispora albida]|uniref:multicopper oxidase family protein n=1 Tax=Longispora albida TaxID=203523 RepID=UPI0003A4D379|nr:multicopper oxidase family protein [Longispora albida]